MYCGIYWNYGKSFWIRGSIDPCQRSRFSALIHQEIYWNVTAGYWRSVRFLDEEGYLDHRAVCKWTKIHSAPASPVGGKIKHIRAWLVFVGNQVHRVSSELYSCSCACIYVCSWWKVCEIADINFIIYLGRCWIQHEDIIPVTLAEILTVSVKVYISPFFIIHSPHKEFAGFALCHHGRAYFKAILQGVQAL